MTRTRPEDRTGKTFERSVFWTSMALAALVLITA
jgi:hypothetical protein